MFRWIIMPPQQQAIFVGPAPVAIVHDREWFQDDERLKNDLWHPVRPQEWSINTPLGDVIHAGSDANFTHSRLDYFLLMFPLLLLNKIVRLTNSELTALNKWETTTGEVLKFFGILILISKFEFSARALLWSNTAPSKYLPGARIGSLTGILVLLVVYVLLVLFYFMFSSFHFYSTEMPRQRIDDLFRCIWFSHQPKECPEGMSSSAHWWMLIDDFVNAINEHRASYFEPSDLICGDESMSK